MEKDASIGPLPQADRQDELQQLSIRALQSRLPAEKFLFRDERVDDKGVDGALEVKVEISTESAGGAEEVRSFFTNCRAQLQLKSTDTVKRNQDGSVSYAIDTANLNYLLNGQSPMYFLWLAASDEIRFAWARDEWRRLDVETPGWRDQSTVAIRFECVLTPEAIPEMHSRILNEARLMRRIHESLARSALSESVVVSINRESLASTDPQQVQALLLQSGMTIVSSGFGQQVVDLVRFLNQEASREPRIQLITAYAQHSIGCFQAALASIAEAAIRSDRLSIEDRQFLRSLRDACEYQTGRIRLDEYLGRQREWADQTTGMAALEHRLDAVRYERLTERDPERRSELMQELRRIAEQILAASVEAAASKLQARIILLSAEGDELVGDFIHLLTLVRMREGMGLAGAGERADSAFRAGEERWRQWEQRAQVILDDAMALRHPMLIGDAMTARLTVRLGLLLQQRLDAVGCGAPWAVEEEAIHTLMSDAENAKQIYSQAGNLEGELRAKLLLADLFEMVGQQAAARSLAEGVLPLAQAMGYARLEAQALEHVAEITPLQSFEQSIAERHNTDQDFSLSERTDRDLRHLAECSVNAMELPIDRVPVVEREWQSQRAIARERLDWCRHLLLLENLEHEQNPLTHFQTDPPRICACDKHKYRSAIEATDWVALISAFKGLYCQGCPDRSPKREP